MTIITKETELKLLDYRERLAEDGWKYAGSGAYGTVHVKGDRAIKTGFVAPNTPYLTYIEECLEKHAGNPWVPCVYSLTRFNEGRDSFFAVEMERLEPTINDIHSWHGSPRQELYAATCKQFQTMNQDPNTRCFHSNSTKEESIRILSESYGEGCIDALKPVAELIFRIVDEGIGCHDFHTSNVMVRAETNQIVITDPVY